MSKKVRKPVPVMIDGEFKTKIPGSNPIVDAVLENANTTHNNKERSTTNEDPKILALNAAMSDLLKKHQEQGSLAFEILKSVVSQKLDQISNDQFDAAKLINSVYQLADAFKHEMDARWSNDVTEVADRINGNFKPKESTRLN